MWNAITLRQVCLRMAQCGGGRWPRGVAYSELIFVFEMQLKHEKQSVKIETFFHAINKGRWRQERGRKEGKGEGSREKE